MSRGLGECVAGRLAHTVPSRPNLATVLLNDLGMQILFQSVCHGSRTLRACRGITVTILLTMLIGIGGNTASFPLSMQRSWRRPIRIPIDWYTFGRRRRDTVIGYPREISRIACVKALHSRT